MLRSRMWAFTRNQKLQKACSSGDLDALRKLLARKPNDLGTFPRNLIEIAARAGHTDLALEVFAAKRMPARELIEGVVAAMEDLKMPTARVLYRKAIELFEERTIDVWGQPEKCFVEKNPVADEDDDLGVMFGRARTFDEEVELVCGHKAFVREKEQLDLLFFRSDRKSDG